jgi:hypothetical protein
MAVAISVDRAGPLFLFFVVTAWVVEIITTALDVDILATVFHVHRVGDTTVFVAVLPAAESSSSTLKALLRRFLNVPRNSDLEAPLLLVA